MAHELDFNSATGRKSVFSVGETPWHREGFVLAEAPSFEEALRLGGLDYEVVTRPALFVSGGEHKQAPGQVVVRTDREVALGVVGPDYVPVQNVDAFGILEPLLDNGLATLETGGALSGGADAWLLVKFNFDNPVIREVFADEVVTFATAITNHSGLRKVRVLETPVRIVCRNTLRAALGNHRVSLEVSHRGDARERLVDAALNLFAGLTDRYVKVAEQYQWLKQRILTVEEFTNSVLEVVAPIPVPRPATTGHERAGYQRAIDLALDRRNAFAAAWEQGVGHSGDHSAWEAYNGVAEVLDHNTELYRTRGSRLASIIDGRLAEQKQAVLESLVAIDR